MLFQFLEIIKVNIINLSKKASINLHFLEVSKKNYQLKKINQEIIKSFLLKKFINF